MTLSTCVANRMSQAVFTQYEVIPCSVNASGEKKRIIKITSSLCLDHMEHEQSHVLGSSSLQCEVIFLENLRHP